MIFYRSAHPYTLGLRGAMPSNDPQNNQQLTAIDGSPPDLFSPPKGCGYHPRCPNAMVLCNQRAPVIESLSEQHWSRCWLHHADSEQRPQGLYFRPSAAQPNRTPEQKGTSQ